MYFKLRFLGLFLGLGLLTPELWGWANAISQASAVNHGILICSQ